MTINTLKPCKKCGAVGDRYSSGKCRSCAKVNSAKRYAENPAKNNAKCAEYRALHADELKDYFKAYRAENSEKIKIRNVAYVAANEEKTKSDHAKYRALNSEKIKTYQKQYTADNAERIKARNAVYYMANKERKKITTRAWNAANAESVKRRGKLNRAENKERIKDYLKAYCIANPEAIKIHRQNRRALKKALGGKLSSGLVEKLYGLQKGKCPCCAQPLGDNYHLDHKMPLALGGDHADENMQLLRALCNLQKHAKHPVDFMQERGFLL